MSISVGSTAGRCWAAGIVQLAYTPIEESISVGAALTDPAVGSTGSAPDVRSVVTVGETDAAELVGSVVPGLLAVNDAAPP